MSSGCLCAGMEVRVRRYVLDCELSWDHFVVQDSSPLFLMGGLVSMHGCDQQQQ